MMNMANTTGSSEFGMMALWPLHILSVIAFFTGVTLLLFWAFKHLSAAQLKQWGWTLVIIGTIVCLFTIGAMGHSWTSTKMGGHVGMMGMMDDDDSESGMNMSMKRMTMMLKGKTGDDFDRAFLEMMIPHHQGAIDMARLAQKYAKHPELKTMADDIIAAQQSEIDRMESWQDSWGYTAQ
jgi:hypothetical protein